MFASAWMDGCGLQLTPHSSRSTMLRRLVSLSRMLLPGEKVFSLNSPLPSRQTLLFLVVFISALVLRTTISLYSQSHPYLETSFFCLPSDSGKFMTLSRLRLTMLSSKRSLLLMRVLGDGELKLYTFTAAINKRNC